MSDYADRLHAEEYYVGAAPLKEGQRLVEQHHYARGGSNTCVYMHGLYYWTGRLVGVAWWLPPTRVACESVNKDNWRKVIALTRLVVAPGVPKNACSFMLSRSVKLIKKDRRFTDLVTYADESQGHLGTIYRATNWNYVGKTGPYPRWVDPKTGRQVASQATKTRTKAQMLALGYELDGKFFKHKYTLKLS